VFLSALQPEIFINSYW